MESFLEVTRIIVRVVRIMRHGRFDQIAEQTINAELKGKR